MKQLITSKCPIPFMKNQIRNLQTRWMQRNVFKLMRMPGKGRNKLEFTAKESIENQTKKWGEIYIISSSCYQKQLIEMYSLKISPNHW